jgi:hypothetical protein
MQAVLISLMFTTVAFEFKNGGMRLMNSELSSVLKMSEICNAKY